MRKLHREKQTKWQRWTKGNELNESRVKPWKSKERKNIIFLRVYSITISRVRINSLIVKKIKIDLKHQFAVNRVCVYKEVAIKLKKIWRAHAEMKRLSENWCGNWRGREVREKNEKKSDSHDTAIDTLFATTLKRLRTPTCTVRRSTMFVTWKRIFLQFSSRVSVVWRALVRLAKRALSCYAISPNPQSKFKSHFYSRT